MTSPIFITGVYRSGTTLVSRLLDVHPELSITYDNIHFMRFCYGRYEPLDRHNTVRLIHDVHDRVSKRWGITFSQKRVTESIFKNDSITYGLVYDELMKEVLLRDTQAKRWGEKTNVAWGKIPDFLSMFPNGKAILIIRDPRDILCSFKKMTTAPWPNYLDSIFASLDAFQKVRHFLKVLPERNFYCIKYEDLVLDAKTHTKKLCDFLEVAFVSEMLDASIYRDKVNGQWKSDTAFDEPLEGISTKAVNRWRKAITDEELLLTETLLAVEMSYFGYSLSGKEFSSKCISDALSLITKTNLLRDRFAHWLKTGCGVEAYPSDPTDPQSWSTKEKVAFKKEALK